MAVIRLSSKKSIVKPVQFRLGKETNMGWSDIDHMKSYIVYDDGAEAPDWRIDENKVSVLLKDGSLVEAHLRPWLTRSEDVSPLRKELGIFYKLSYQLASAVSGGKDFDVVKWSGDGIWREGHYYDLVDVAIRANSQ